MHRILIQKNLDRQKLKIIKNYFKKTPNHAKLNKNKLSKISLFTDSHISEGNCVIIQLFVCEFKTPTDWS